MFKRLDVWIVSGFLFYVLVASLYAWVSGMRQTIKEQKQTIGRLNYELDTREREVSWLKARCESRTEHRVIIRDSEIDQLREELEEARNECKRLEHVLNQKWKAVTEDDFQVG